VACMRGTSARERRPGREGATVKREKRQVGVLAGEGGEMEDAEGNGDSAAASARG
jgi:hypothetical protein